MKRPAAVLGITGLVLATMTGAPAPAVEVQSEAPNSTTKRAQKPKPCPPARSKTLDAGVEGEIYVPARTSQRDGEQDPVTLCSYAGRRRLIGYDDCFNAQQPGIIRFAGRFLGLESTECTPGGTFASIAVLRVRDGARVRRLDPAPGVTYLPGGSPLTIVSVRDLVMRADGALAWIVSVEDPMTGPSGFQVRSSAAGRDSVALAAGEGIEAGSLALAGSRIYWRLGGVPQSSELPPADAGALRPVVGPRVRRARRCEPRGSRALDASRQARVFVRRTRSGAPPVFACHLRSRRSVRLGFRGEDGCSGGQVLGFRLAGRYAAARIYDCTSTGDAAELVEVYDLIRGRRVSQTLAASVSDVLLLSDGTAVLISARADRPVGGGGPGPGTRSVGYTKAGTQPVTLASGPASDIAEGSLAAAGRSAYWMQGGQPRSALLP